MTLAVSWEITNACHLRCATCLPASGERRPGELDLDEVVRTLEALRVRGVASVLFSGGEPFFRRDFPDVLDACARLGLPVAVITSGTLFSRRALAAVRRSRARLSVSFDGATAAVHDRVRGAGMFDRAVEGCRRLADADLPFDLSATVSRPNLDEIEAIARLARDLGANRVFYSEVSRGGRAAENWDWLGLDDEQRDTLPERVAAAAAAVFGDGPLGVDDACWVNGAGMYVDARGWAYLCSEIAQQAPERAVARLGEPGGVDLALDTVASELHGHRTCLYSSFASEHTALTLTSHRPCAVLVLGASVPVAAPTHRFSSREEVMQ